MISRLITAMIGVLILISLTNASDFSSFREIQNSKVLLTEQAKFLEELVNKNDPQVSMIFHKGSGTSAYVEISYLGNKLGALLAQNSATKIRGEITSFHFARLLGFANIYSPKTLMLLEGQGVLRYREEMQKLLDSMTSFPETNPKKINARKVIQMIDQDNKLFVAYAPWNERPMDWEELATDNNHPLRQALLAATPLSEELLAAVKLPSPTDAKYQVITLARELSNQFVVDILMGQWDRFSGGNIQYYIEKNEQGKFVHIGSFDNGGTFSFSRSNLEKYLSIVSRFDKQTIDRIRELNRMLNQRSAISALGLSSELELRQELEMLDVVGPLPQIGGSEVVWKNIKMRIDALVQHVDNVCVQFGDSNCFF